jgi:hypothetical protein
MSFFLDVIAQLFLTGLGTLIKRMFGKPRSDSGDSEFWIGLLAAVLIGTGVFTAILYV